MRNRLAFFFGSIAIALCACDRGSNETPDPVAPRGPEPSPLALPAAPPSVTIENQEISNGVFVTLEADTVTSKRRPTIVLVCDGARSPSFQLYTRDAPAAPPPLRGVHGEFTVDGGPVRRVELSWGTNDVWLPRRGAEAAGLVRQFLNGGELRFVPPPSYSNGAPITWRTANLAPRRAEVRRWCLP